MRVQFLSAESSITCNLLFNHDSSKSTIFMLNMTFQGRSQDLNQPLQNTVQNFDNDVIIMTLTSLL